MVGTVSRGFGDRQAVDVGLHRNHGPLAVVDDREDPGLADADRLKPQRRQLLRSAVPYSAIDISGDRCSSL